MKILLITFFFFSSFNSYSQLEIGGGTKKNLQIGNVKRAGTFLASFHQSLADSSFYFILYNNLEFQTITDIKSIDFKASAKDIDNLYSFFLSCFDKEKDFEESLKLGESNILVTLKKTLGVKTLYISVLSPITNKGFFNITKKELNKLFNKVTEE